MGKFSSDKIFDDNCWLWYVMLIALFSGYSINFVYFWRKRNSIALKARSPKLIFLGWFFLCADSVSNSIIFYTKYDSLACALSIICTVFFSEDHKIETVNIRIFVYVCITCDSWYNSCLTVLQRLSESSHNMTSFSLYLWSQTEEPQTGWESHSGI